MVKPRDQDVVFMEDVDDERAMTSFATPQKRLCSIPSQSSSSLALVPSSETSGNSIFKKLLLEYYDEYFAVLSSFHQQQVRKVFLERFRNEMADLDTQKSSSPSVDSRSTSTNTSQPQFLVHRTSKQTSCFTKVFFKPNIDQKIVSSMAKSTILLVTYLS